MTPSARRRHFGGGRPFSPGDKHTPGTGAIDIYTVCQGRSAPVTLYMPNGNERNFPFPCDGRGRYVHDVAVPKFSQMRLVTYVLNGVATGWTSACDG